MKINKLTILFLLLKARTNAKGECPIRCRITYLEERHEFSTGLFLNPNSWYSKHQLAKPPNNEIHLSITN